MKGSCTAVIVGPVIGVLFFLGAAYLFWKNSKSGRATVDTTETFGKSSTSI